MRGGFVVGVVIVLLAGCAQPDGQDIRPAQRQDEPSVLDGFWDAAVALPYQEDAADIERLAAFEAGLGTGMLDCGPMAWNETVHVPLRALRSFLGNCFVVQDDLWKAARDARAQGLEDPMWDDLQIAFDAAMSSAQRQISAIRPGTAVDAAVLVLLMDDHEWNVDVGTRSLADARSTTGLGDREFESLLLNIVRPIESAANLERVVRNFPWTFGDCQPPPWGDVEGNRDSFLQRHPAVGWPEDRAIDVPMRVDHMGPTLALYRSLGWSFALSNEASLLRAYEAYMADLTTPLPPTAEVLDQALEALNDTKTVMGMARLQGDFDYYEWNQFEDGLRLLVQTARHQTPVPDCQ